MSDRDDTTDRGVSRREFLTGGFLTRGLRRTTTRRGGGSETAETCSRDDGDHTPDLSPETRGPAVDLDAILARAESIAGVSESGDATPHPQYQDGGPDEADATRTEDSEETDDE